MITLDNILISYHWHSSAKKYPTSVVARYSNSTSQNKVQRKQNPMSRTVLHALSPRFMKFRACSCQASLYNKLATSQSAPEFEHLRTQRVTA